MNSEPTFLSFHGISKTFPGVKALQDISFDCRGGEVHALWARTAQANRRC